MTELFDKLDKLANERGLSLTEACRRAGVAPSTIWGWRERLPKTLDTLWKIERELADDAARNNDTPDEGTPPRNNEPQ